MVDTHLFKFIMKKNGDNGDTLAAALGISRTSLSMKINNKQDFKLSELRILAGRYKLTLEMANRLFGMESCR